MSTPLVLSLVRARVSPVEISHYDLTKILLRGPETKSEKQHVHNDQLIPEVINKVPRALVDPLMIFKSYSGTNGEVCLTVSLNLKDKNGTTLIVPFELEYNAGNYLVNEIKSVYGKNDKRTGEPRYEWFEKNVKNIVYINKEKTASWIKREELETFMPRLSTDGLSKINVPDETDTVKLWNENPELYQSSGQHLGTYDPSQHIKNLGKADPPEDVRRIFDTMLATDLEAGHIYGCT